MENNFGNKYKQLIKELYEALVNDNGIQRLADICQEIFDNPFWVVDINFNFLTVPSKEMDSYLWEEAQKGYVSDKTITDLRNRSIYRSLKSTGKPVRYSTWLNPDLSIIAAPIRVQETIVGFLQLSNTHSPYKGNEEELEEYISKIFALELRKTRYQDINLDSMISTLLTDILTGTVRNTEKINERMNLLGISLGKSFQILTINRNNPGLISDLYLIANQIRNIIPNSFFISRPGQVVFLISLVGADYLDEKTMDSIYVRLLGNGLHAGLSPVFHDITHSRVYLNLAEQAAEMGYLYSPGTILFKYYDYMPFHIAESYYSKVPFFATPAGLAIQKLRDYDSKNHTDLFNTLKCYLDNVLNITNTASSLFIHGNTLRKRLDKIMRITGCSFESGREIIEYHIAILYMEYHKNTL